MSKVDTEEGLGPGSEDRRREVLEAQKELDSRSKMKAAAPVPVDKNADTQPGIGKVDRRSDTVDDLLDGFGPSRPDLPRILPKEDTTPPPEPLRRELTPTAPGKRQRMRNMILATVVSFGVIVGLGVVIVRMGASSGSSAAAPTTSAPAATSATTVQTSAPAPTQTVAPITTMSVEALPTATTTTTAHPAHSTHSSNHTAASSTTTAATTAAPHPTGSAPPGMNLLPDDPHR